MAARLPAFLIPAAGLPAAALDDLPIYGDVGCGRGTIEQSYAQVNGGTLAGLAGGKAPITCADKHGGTDAVTLELPQNLAVGGYFDVILKFPDWGQKDLKAYKDVRFWAKNLLATDAHVTLKWENGPAYRARPSRRP